MMNIIRDPFWGRNHEGYSEDPYLTGELAHSVVIGMQGLDERYLQVVAGCKHFAPYDGLASSRASDYDLFSTYLPGYKRCMEARGNKKIVGEGIMPESMRFCLCLCLCLCL